MIDKRWLPYVRGCTGCLLIAVSLCIVAWFTGGWLGHLRRVKPPAGFEETPIPGVFVDRHVADLGLVVPDRLIEETFRLVNRGSSTYVVNKAATDCGCATVNLADLVLPSRGTLNIPIKMDVSALQGDAFKKGVFVELAPIGHDVVYRDVFRIRGQIDRSGTFAAWPGVIDCGATTAGATIVKHVFVKGDRALLDQLPSRLMVARFPQRIGLRPAGHSRHLDIKRVEIAIALPAEAPPGPFESSITLELPGSVSRQIHLGVRARITSGLMATPERVLLCPTGDATTTSVIIASTNQSPVVIEKVSSVLPIRWTVSRYSGVQGVVTLTGSVDRDAIAERLVGGSLQVETEDGRMIVIPVLILRTNDPHAINSVEEPVL